MLVGCYSVILLIHLDSSRKMAELTWKQVQELFKGNGGAFHKIDWTRSYDKIAQVLKVKRDER